MLYIVCVAYIRICNRWILSRHLNPFSSSSVYIKLPTDLHKSVLSEVPEKISCSTKHKHFVDKIVLFIYMTMYINLRINTIFNTYCQFSSALFHNFRDRPVQLLRKIHHHKPPVHRPPCECEVWTISRIVCGSHQTGVC